MTAAHPKRNDQIVSEFRSQRDRQRIAAIFALLVAIFLFGSGWFSTRLASHVGFPVVLALNIAAIVGFMVWMVWVSCTWKCPTCRTSLGMDFNARFCGKCGIPLQ